MTDDVQTPAVPATPAAAQTRLNELTADMAWGKRLDDRDPAAVAEFQSVSKIALRRRHGGNAVGASDQCQQSQASRRFPDGPASGRIS